VPGDEPAGLVGVPARDSLHEAGVDRVPAAHLLRGGGVRGREDFLGPVPRMRDLRLWAGGIGGGSLAL